VRSRVEHAENGSTEGQPQGNPPIWDTPGAIACGASLTHAYGHKAWSIKLFIGTCREMRYGVVPVWHKNAANPIFRATTVAMVLWCTDTRLGPRLC
jgi:hypothetical protein